MADSTPAPTSPATAVDPQRWRRDVLIGGAIMLGALSLAYFVLGRQYYIGKFSDDFVIGDDEDAVKAAAWAATTGTYFFSYLVFSLVASVAVTTALLWPRYVAHALAAGFGVLYLASAAMILFRTRMPVLVGVFQATIGGVILRLAYSSWKDKDRAAWAFLLSLSAVLAGTMLFGAPRIKAATGAPGLWWVMLIPVSLTAQAIALYSARRDYA